MGKASRVRKQRRSHQKSRGKKKALSSDASSRPSSDDAALLRLIKSGMHGRLSLASAYAWGYAAIGLAQQDGTEPDWFHDLDPLDLIVLGAATPKEFRDALEFGNARTAWLRMLRDTRHWDGVELFVTKTLQLSEDFGLPVDSAELLKRLNGRIEGTRLERELPAALHLEPALSAARFLHGPSEDFTLPEPTEESIRLAELLLHELEVSDDHDATCAGKLRDGLSILARFDAPVHTDSSVLLIALYIGLVASDNEPLEDLAKHAEAWALGLREDSPLIPVADLLLVASTQNLSPLRTASLLFTIPAFVQLVGREDARWHSEPGTELIPLAFEFGWHQVKTRDGRSIRVDAATAASLTMQQRQFEEQFGRPPSPDDPIFVDPDADMPTAVSKADLDDAWSHMLDTAGTHAAWRHAFLDDAPPPRLDGTFRSDKERRDWYDSIKSYVEAHPDEDAPDAATELAKLRSAHALMTISTSSDDDGFAEHFLTALDSDVIHDDISVDVVVDLLEALEPVLVSAFESDIAMRQRALTWANKRGSGAMTDRVRACVAADSELPDHAALFVLAIAYVRTLQTEPQRGDVTS
jgi:hypothetical protein